MAELILAGLPCRYWTLIDADILSEEAARAMHAAEPALPPAPSDAGTEGIEALQEGLRMLVLEVGQVRTANAQLTQRVLALEAVARRTGRVG